MFKKLLLYVICIISILWIGYVGIDIIDKENQFSPIHLFGEKDGKILIINRINEASLEQIKFNTTPSNNRIVSSLLPWLKKDNELIVSEKQNQIYIDINENWTKNKIVQLFKNAKIPLSFSGFKTFNTGNYIGIYAQSILYLHFKNVVKPNKIVDWRDFDRKASMSIVSVRKNAHSTIDYYVKDNSIIEYASIANLNLKGRQQSDEELFSEALPNQLENYHFIESEFNTQIDKYFEKSPMNQWIDNGSVTFTYDNETAIICDYKEEQNPILVLNDFSKNTDNIDEESGFYRNIQLTKEFPKNKAEGFYIKTMDDYVVLSSSEEVCEKIIADYKLGNTIALKKDKLKLLYDDLPKKVSERILFKDYKISKSKYKSKIITTKVNIDSKKIVEEVKSNSLSMHIGQDVQDMFVLNGTGNLIVLTKAGNLIGFNKGKENWKKELIGYPFGTINTIQYNSEKHFIINTSKELYLFNQFGELASGFPVQFNKNATNQVTFFNHKGMNLFAIANESNEICVYNSKGKLVTSIKTKLTKISKPINVWISNKSTLLGTSDEFNYSIFNYEKKRELRSFNVPSNSISIELNNEIEIYGIDKNKLVKIDQKGTISIITNTIDGKIIKVVNEFSEPIIVIQNQNELLKMNALTKKIQKQTLSFGQIDDVFILDNDLITGLVDGIGNNVYIYKNSNQLNEKALEGKGIVKLTYSNNDLIITTLMDDYIIQYSQY